MKLDKYVFYFINFRMFLYQRCARPTKARTFGLNSVEMLISWIIGNLTGNKLHWDTEYQANKYNETFQLIRLEDQNQIMLRDEGPYNIGIICLFYHLSIVQPQFGLFCRQWSQRFEFVCRPWPLWSLLLVALRSPSLRTRPIFKCNYKK